MTLFILTIVLTAGMAASLAWQNDATASTVPSWIKRGLWALGVVPICLLMFPVLPLALIVGLLRWVFTGKSLDDVLFGAWDHPPLKWVGAYFEIYLK